MKQAYATADCPLPESIIYSISDTDDAIQVTQRYITKQYRTPFYRLKIACGILGEDVTFDFMYNEYVLKHIVNSKTLIYIEYQNKYILKKEI